MTLILKKYPNRRLYDTEKSAYVTLKEVADAIKEGRKVMVLDAKTDEDVTEFVLMQILLELTRNKSFTLPVSLLHLFIRFGETVLNEFFDKYLEKTLTGYIAYKKNMDDQFEKYLELGIDLTRLAQKTFTFPGFSDMMKDTNKNDKK